MLRFTPIILLLLLADASIAQVHWATKVVDFSSQYDDLGHSASQVLGTPDVEPELKARTGAWMPGYRLVNGELVFDRELHGLRNTVLLSAGWEVSGVSQSGTIGRTREGRMFVALVNLNAENHFRVAIRARKP